MTGTDPIFGIILSPFLKWLRPKAKIVHWCFDLYPEAAIADGVIKEKNRLISILNAFLNPGYKACDLVADLGPCMRNQLKKYPVKASITLTPWAQEEPPKPLVFDHGEREIIFRQSNLALLYSGSFGRAHDYTLTLALARLMRKQAIFAYSARGSRLEELKRVVNPEDTNIQFIDFAPMDKLTARLSAPDVHLVSLRPEWSGIVVPSKFFGILAVGRPVLFDGGENSSIALWIREHKLGWVLKPDNLEEVAKDLLQFSQDNHRKTEMFHHCYQVYQSYFSRKVITDRWYEELRNLLLRALPIESKKN